MKFYDLGIWIFIGIVAVAMGTSALNYFFKDMYPDDNIFEEMLEDQIEKSLHLPEHSIDLSPDTKESCL